MKPGMRKIMSKSLFSRQIKNATNKEYSIYKFLFAYKTCTTVNPR